MAKDDGFDPNRSLAPKPGKAQPFQWDKARVTPVVRSLRERIDQVTGSQMPPASLKTLKRWFRTEHVFHSNAIGGTSLTLYETKVVIDEGLTVGGKKLRDVVAAKTLADAVDWVEKVSGYPEPLSQASLRHLHSLIVRGDSKAMPGEYRRADQQITGARHQVPSATQTEPLMDKFSRYLAADKPELDAVIESAIVHVWLAGIHPFQDGNGRTARLLSNLVLRRRDSLFALLQSQDAAKYHRALDVAHGTGNITDFIVLWSQCVANVVNEYERLIGDQEAREKALGFVVGRNVANTDEYAREVVHWRDTVKLLSGEVKEMLDQINARTGSYLKVSTRDITVKTITKAHRRPAAVIDVSGEMKDSPISESMYLKLNKEKQLCLTPFGILAVDGIREIAFENGRFQLRMKGEAVESNRSAAETAARVVEQFIRTLDV